MRFFLHRVMVKVKPPKMFEMARRHKRKPHNTGGGFQWSVQARCCQAADARQGINRRSDSNTAASKAPLWASSLQFWPRNGRPSREMGDWTGAPGPAWLAANRKGSAALHGRRHPKAVSSSPLLPNFAPFRRNDNVLPDEPSTSCSGEPAA